MDPSVSFVAVASELHLRRAREVAGEAYLALEAEGVELQGSPEPVLRPEELLEAVSSPSDLKVVFVASGGTSRLLRGALAGIEALLWAHPGDNSLPSALSAREKLRASGAWASELLFSSPGEVPSEIKAEIRILRALKAFDEAEVLAICGEEKASELQEALEALLGRAPAIKRMGVRILMGQAEARVEEPSLSEAISTLKGITGEEVTPELEKGLIKSVQLANFISEKLLKDAKVPVITFDCFDIIREVGLAPCVVVGLLLERGITAVCEADPAALFLMAICHLVSGSPPWMANLARFDESSRTITLAHCTACPSLAASWPYRGTFLTHFESGRPVALDIWLRRAPVVLANLQVGNKKLVLARGRIRDSGLGEERLCRTQALVELEGDMQTFLAETGNHQIVSYADIYEELRRLGRRLGLEVVAT